MKTLITLFMLLSLSCRAEIVLLKQGDIAPFEGALVDQAQMKEFREIKTRLDLEVKQNNALKELNLRLGENVDYHKAEVRKLEKDIYIVKAKSKFTNIAYFALGMALTGLVTKFAIESTK